MSDLQNAFLEAAFIARSHADLNLIAFNDGSHKDQMEVAQEFGRNLGNFSLLEIDADMFVRSHLGYGVAESFSKLIENHQNKVIVLKDIDSAGVYAHHLTTVIISAAHNSAIPGGRAFALIGATSRTLKDEPALQARVNMITLEEPARINPPSQKYGM